MTGSCYLLSSHPGVAFPHSNFRTHIWDLPGTCSHILLSEYLHGNRNFQTINPREHGSQLINYFPTQIGWATSKKVSFCVDASREPHPPTGQDTWGQRCALHIRGPDSQQFDPLPYNETPYYLISGSGSLLTENRSNFK